MSVSYFRKSSENTQSLFSLMQGLLALPWEKDFKLQRPWQVSWSDDWEAKEQVLGEFGSVEASGCN